MGNELSALIKELRKKYGLTQLDLAQQVGVGLRFVRELEQGKETHRMDKVNDVLQLFEMELGAVRSKREEEQWGKP